MGDAGSKAFDFRLDNIAHTLGRGRGTKVHEQSMLPARRSIERSLDRRRLAIRANRGFQETFGSIIGRLQMHNR